MCVCVWSEDGLAHTVYNCFGLYKRERQRGEGETHPVTLSCSEANQRWNLALYCFCGVPKNFVILLLRCVSMNSTQN